MRNFRLQLLLIIMGGLMLFAGAALAFLMVIKLLATSYFLVFLSYGFTVAGFVLSSIGMALYYYTRR